MKRAPVMKNAPHININDSVTTTAPASKTPAAPAVANLTSRLRGMTGHNITLPVCGRDVVFTLKNIDADMVKKATMVWSGNERVQELLSESALADLIPSFTTAGQQNPAIGRMVSGVVEVADGSRRRQTAILTGNDYRILVGDLDEEQMAWLSKIGNDYRPTSAYERGKRYARRLATEFDGNVSKLAEAENISRKIIMRCMKTAELPHQIISLFSSPNELSARAGDSLAKTYASNESAMHSVAVEIASMQKNGQSFDTAELLNLLSDVSRKNDKPTAVARSFADGITAKYIGDKVQFQLDGVPSQLVKKIEDLLDEYQQEIQIKIRNEVNESLTDLDRVVSVIKSAAACINYEISSNELQSMIPHARNVITETHDESSQISRISDELKIRFVF